jgi:TPR repeat protein
VYHEDGFGVEKNDSLAIEWYKKAVAQEYPEAQYRLAQCYERGKGVKKDKAQADSLMKEAADMGHVEAQEATGMTD